MALIGIALVHRFFFGSLFVVFEGKRLLRVLYLISFGDEFIDKLKFWKFVENSLETSRNLTSYFVTEKLVTPAA